MLFQIVDDILDVTGTDDALGKPRGSDERHSEAPTLQRVRGSIEPGSWRPESHRTARGALAQAGAEMDSPDALGELEQITDFIYTRTS